MRYYVLTPGSSSYIWAEWATPVRESAWAEEDPDEFGDRRRGLGGASAADGDMILIRAELLADPDYSEALRRWEAKDDAAFETQDWARSIQGAREDLERDAANGCTSSKVLLAANPDGETIYNFVVKHSHSDLCNWSLESI